MASDTPVTRKEHHTENHYEKEYGFSQAVRIGKNLWVAGITATSPQGVLHKGDMYKQAMEIFRSDFEKLALILERLTSRSRQSVHQWPTSYELGC